MKKTFLASAVALFATLFLFSGSVFADYNATAAGGTNSTWSNVILGQLAVNGGADTSNSTDVYNILFTALSGGNATTNGTFTSNSAIGTGTNAANAILSLSESIAATSALNATVFSTASMTGAEVLAAMNAQASAATQTAAGFSANITAATKTVQSGLSAARSATKQYYASIDLDGVAVEKAMPEGPAGGIRLSNYHDPKAIRIWGKYILSHADQGSVNGVNGYEYTGHGPMIGIDKTLTRNLILGLNIGYVFGDTDFDGGGDADTDELSVGIYGTVFNDRLYVDFGLSYHLGDVDGTGSPFGSTITYSTDYDAFAFFTELGYNCYFKKPNAMITPAIGFHASFVETDGYTQSGTGAATIGEDDNDFFTTKLGAKGEFVLGSKSSLKARAFWWHEFSDDMENGPTMTYVGATTSFNTVGLDVDEDRLQLGLGFKFMPNANWDIDFDYDLEAGDQFDSHTGTLQFKYKF